MYEEKALNVSTFYRDRVISATKHSAMFFMVRAFTVESFLSLSFHLKINIFMQGFKSVYLTHFNLIKAAVVRNQVHYTR